MTAPHTTDFLVVGGGVIGLNVALELKRRRGDCSVTLLEKEPAVGAHASGRNSGVIHAGFYYTADSLKARFTRQGNLALHAYCEAHGIKVNRCGKLVVARDANDLPGLDELLRRGRANGVPLEEVSEDEARRIEPRAKTHQRAIFSPSTSSADPLQVIDCLRTDAERAGVVVRSGAKYLGRRGGAVLTNEGECACGYVVNAAGFYADVVARDFGFSSGFRILPFKGLYLYSDEPPWSFRTNVYPVPDLRNPFLGVHFTVTADGHAKIGPTAMPALWREQYGGLSRFSLGELAEIGARMTTLLFRAGFDFRSLAVDELRKYSKRRMVRLAAALARDVDLAHYRRWGKPGIRAQLLDLSSNKLVMDFVLEGDERSMHVLNAVSPGWTCAIPFAAYVCDRIESLAGKGR